MAYRAPGGQPLRCPLDQLAEHEPIYCGANTALHRRYPMPNELPPTIDSVAASRWAALVNPGAGEPSGSPWLHEEVARRMEERLGWIKLQPQCWAHWEPTRGGMQAHALLARRYPQAACFVTDSSVQRLALAQGRIAKPWWSPARWTAASTRFEVPPEGSAQMLWANMLLHHAADPQALMAQWHRALAVDGFLMFSCFGPDTLRELRGLYQSLGWSAPAHEFTDMHDWGDMLAQAGFAEPVMDMERITLTFETPPRLLQELRELGRNLHPGRFPGLRGRMWLARLHKALAEHLARPGDGGRLSLTFEIIYGHAFKPAPRLRVQAESQVTLEEMRAALRQRKKN
jgi:malonyl-CoA O-methyltransferase